MEREREHRLKTEKQRPAAPALMRPWGGLGRAAPPRIVVPRFCRVSQAQAPSPGALQSAAVLNLWFSLLFPLYCADC